MISWYRQQRLRKKLGKYDPYAIVLYTKICRKIENASLVGHLPHGISKFFKFYSEQGGTLTAAAGSRSTTKGHLYHFQWQWKS